MIEFNLIDKFPQVIWWWPQVYNKLKEYEIKMNYKVIKVIKFMSKNI